MRAGGIAITFGHGLAADVLIWAIAIGLALVINASQTDDPGQRRTRRRLIAVAALVALGVLLYLDL